MPLHPVCDICIVLDPSGIHGIDIFETFFHRRQKKWWQMFHFGWTIPLVQEAANAHEKVKIFLEIKVFMLLCLFFLVDSEFWSSGPVHLSGILTQRLLARKENVRLFWSNKSISKGPFSSRSPVSPVIFLLLLSVSRSHSNPTQYSWNRGS